MPNLVQSQLPISVATVADLRPTVDGGILQTAGYYTVGDGGGTSWVYRRSGRPGSLSLLQLAGSGADDYYELQSNRTIKPILCGLRMDGTTDEGVLFQQFLDLLNTTAFDRVEVEGKLYTTTSLTWDGGGVSGPNKNFYIDLTIFSNAALDTLITLTQHQLADFNGGKLILYGHTSAGALPTWADRNVRDGVYMTFCERLKGLNVEAYNFKRYGIWGDGDGSSNNTLMDLGAIRVKDCGEAYPRGAGMHEATWSSLNNSGSSGSGGQLSRVNVDDLPYDNDTSAEPIAVTVDHTTNTFSGASFVEGDRVQIASTGTYPAGLTSPYRYWVFNVSGSTFQLCDDYDAIVAETATAVDITSNGSGTITAAVQTLSAIECHSKYVTVCEPEITVTPDHTTDTFTAAGHNLRENDRVYIKGATTIPTGFNATFPYFVINVDGDDFQLANNVGDAPINFTSNGVGDVTVERMSLHTLKTWGESHNAGGADQLWLYPWIPLGSSGGKLYYHCGAGVRLQGNDAASINIDQIDGLRCATVLDISNLYGPIVKRIVAQFNNMGISVGRGQSSALLGGVIAKSYSEANNWDFVKRSTTEPKMQVIGMSPFSWARTKFLGPKLSNGVETAPGMVGVTFLDDRLYNLEVDLPIGAVGSVTVLKQGQQAHIRANSGTVRLTLDPDIDRNFGRPACRIFILGSGANKQATGKTTFELDTDDAARGVTLSADTRHNGVSINVDGDVEILAVRPIWVDCYYYYATQTWEVVPQFNESDESFAIPGWMRLEGAGVDPIANGDGMLAVGNGVTGDAGDLIYKYKSSDGEVTIRSIYDFSAGSGSLSRNLLTKTELFDNAAWTKALMSVTADATTGPAEIGGSTADELVVDSSASSFHGIYTADAVTAATGEYYTLSTYVKANTFTDVLLGFNRVDGSTTHSLHAKFDLTGETAATAGDGLGGMYVDSGIIDKGAGWYRIWVTVLIDDPGALNARVVLSDGSASSLVSPYTFTGNGTDSIYVCGAQLEKANAPSIYNSVS